MGAEYDLPTPRKGGGIDGGASSLLASPSAAARGASKYPRKAGELFVSKRERATGGGNDVGRDVARGVERWEYGNEHSSEEDV